MQDKPGSRAKTKGELILGISRTVRLLAWQTIGHVSIICYHRPLTWRSRFQRVIAGFWRPSLSFFLKLALALDCMNSVMKLCQSFVTGI